MCISGGTNEIHDRFWIDPDNKKDLIIETSLNGIGKKIFLFDSLEKMMLLSLWKLLKIWNQKD